MDSDFISTAGTLVICEVGPAGGNYRRPDEWMYLKSLSERAGFIAVAILQIAQCSTKIGFCLHMSTGGSHTIARWISSAI